MYELFYFTKFSNKNWMNPNIWKLDFDLCPLRYNLEYWEIAVSWQWLVMKKSWVRTLCIEFSTFVCSFVKDFTQSHCSMLLLVKIFSEVQWLKSVFLKKVLGKIASSRNLQKLPRWFHSFQQGSFCKFLDDAIFPSTFLKKQTLILHYTPYSSYQNVVKTTSRFV